MQHYIVIALLKFRSIIMPNINLGNTECLVLTQILDLTRIIHFHFHKR